MKQWKEWYDEVLPDVPGVPQPVAKNAIRNACIDFCARSLVLLADIDPMNAIANQAEYDFEPDSGTVVVKALRLWYAKREIYVKTPDDLNALYANWPSENGTPSWFTQEKPGSFLLVPYPNADLASAITGKVALKPARTSSGCEDFLFEEYLEAIASGAKARLFAMKSKPWTDGALTAFHGGMFDTAIGAASVRAAKAFGRAPVRVKARFF